MPGTELDRVGIKHNASPNNEGGVVDITVKGGENLKKFLKALVLYLSGYKPFTWGSGQSPVDRLHV